MNVAMPMSMFRTLVLALLLAPACASAADHKSYRQLVEAMDVFEKNRQLAPKASLRFRLLPRQPDVNMQGIELNLVGSASSFNVPLAPDTSFTLERNPQALSDNAGLVPNRPVDSLAWRAEVRSPGLDQGMRRLGDLRLECMVGLTAQLMTFYPMTSRLWRDLERQAREGCHSTTSTFPLFAERPLFKVTLYDGNRTEILTIRNLYAGGVQRSAEWLAHSDSHALQDRAYFAPIQDKSWSDDTLIEFDYMDDEPMPEAAFALGAGRANRTRQGRMVEIGKSSKADVKENMGQANQLAFRSGYEVWSYTTRTRQPAPGKEHGEEAIETIDTVVLFDPSGKVKKLHGFFLR